MDELIAFLRARWDEEEADARSASAERRAERRPDRVDRLIEQALAETRDHQWLREGRQP
ncbi:hypothetical protein [Streptosporangium sp. NPDC003464]